MVDYPYSTGPLLEKRNTYFYTEFQGLPFLKSWHHARKSTLDALTPGDVIQEEPASVDFDFKMTMDMFENDKFVDTRTLFRMIQTGISGRKEQIEQVENIVYGLVKRFEVTKRIHSSYNFRFQPEDKQAYHDMPLYVMAAEVFKTAYKVFCTLPLLNAALKCIDILCALKDDLEVSYHGDLADLIVWEHEQINKVAGSAGVEL